MIDNWLSAHGTRIVLLQPFFEAVHVKDMLVRAVQFCNLLSIRFWKILKANCTLCHLSVPCGIVRPGLLLNKVVDTGHSSQLILCLLSYIIPATDDYAAKHAAAAQAYAAEEEAGKHAEPD